MLTTENWDPILDQLEKCGNISVEVRAELDRTTFTVLELLSLERGSLLEFSRSTGENIDTLLPWVTRTPLRVKGKAP